MWLSLNLWKISMKLRIVFIEFNVFAGTFTPRTTEVPAFVKRMAASTRLDKSAMGYAGYGTPRPALPDRSWR